MKPEHRNLILSIAVSLVALGVALWGIRPERFLEVMQDVEPLYLLPAVLMTLLGLFTRAQSWRVILQKKIPLLRSFNALNEGYLLNNALPFRAGEIGRAYLISRDTSVTFGGAVASVLIERIVDTIVSLTGLVIAIPLIVRIDWARNLAFIVGVVLLVVFLGLFMLTIFQERVLNLLGRLPKRMGWLVRSEMMAFLEALKTILRPGTLLTAGVWSTMAWATTWAQLGFVMSAFGLNTTFAANLLIIGVTAFGAALPSSPGAIGVFELSAMAGMLAVGQPREGALAVAIVWHILQVAVTGILGAIALSREGHSLKSLASIARSPTHHSPESETV